MALRPTTKVLEFVGPGEDLFAKAIRAPNQLTDEERQTVTRFPPDNVIDQNVQRATGGGSTRAELVEKAAHDPESLTFPECRLLWDRYHILTGGERIDRLSEFRLPEEERDRRAQARKLLMIPNEDQALDNAIAVFSKKHKEYFEPIHAARLRASTQPPPWVQKLIDDPQPWGYIIYHTQECENGDDETTWSPAYVATREVSMKPHPCETLGGEHIAALKVIEWSNFVAPEAAALSAIRKNFQSLRAINQLGPGVLPNVFLLDTQESMKSHAEDYELVPWIWACDPDWTEDGPDADGYDGGVKVARGRVYQLLYGLLSERRFSIKDIWQDAQQPYEPIPSDLRGELPPQPAPPPFWYRTRLDRPGWPAN